jgi:GNAT superfamily N-acetyltransferase
MSDRAQTPRFDPNAPLVARLRDGERVTVRPVDPADEPALREFIASLGAEARRLRFFSGAVDLGTAARNVAATGPERIGLIAHDERGHVVGHAMCVELEPRRAEVAVEVADRLHGEGVGTILVERLARLAEGRGITHFTAEVLPENRAMLDVFRDGFDARVSWSAGAEHVEFPTEAWRLARDRYDA